MCIYECYLFTLKFTGYIYRTLEQIYSDLYDQVIKEKNIGLLYKGCERPHWRASMPGKKRNIIRKIFKQEEFYYHQIFFHYVLQNGNRAHFAWDMPLR